MKFTCPGQLGSLLKCLFIIYFTLSSVESRKSYIVKQKIEDGDIKVGHPRVRAYDCEWCFFKDANNDFCISGNVDWKIESKTTKINQEDIVNSVNPHYKHSLVW